MHLSTYLPRVPGSRSRRTTARWLAVPAVALGTLAFAGAAQAATPVPLATAESFAILAGSGITNTGPTTVNGDIGTFPITTIADAGALTITGVNHGGDGVTQQAKLDLVNAYNVAAGQGPPSPIVADLGGQTLVPGVYNSASSIGLTGALTLNGGGDPNAVFVFQAGSTLTTAGQVNLVNGTQACNVFWQVGSSATLGTGTVFRGTILARDSISLITGTTVVGGRLLAANGAVTLDTNVITRPPTCVAPTPTAVFTPTDTTATDTSAPPETPTPVDATPSTTAASTAPNTAAANAAAAARQRAAIARKRAAAKRAAAARKRAVARRHRAAVAQRQAARQRAQRARRAFGLTG
jgi:Ice-binding-like